MSEKGCKRDTTNEGATDNVDDNVDGDVDGVGESKKNHKYKTNKQPSTNARAENKRLPNNDRPFNILQKEHKKLESNYNKLQVQAATQITQINEIKAVVKDKAKQLTQQANELNALHKQKQKELTQSAEIEKKDLQNELAKAEKQLRVLFYNIIFKLSLHINLL